MASFPGHLDGGVVVDGQQVAMTMKRTLTLPKDVVSSRFVSAGELHRWTCDGASGWRIGEMGKHFVDQGG
jgi:hypothetical protein